MRSFSPQALFGKVIGLFCCCLFFALLNSCGEVTGGVPPLVLSSPEAAAPAIDVGAMRKKAAEAEVFVEDKGMRSSYCYLADMSLHSGVKRMVKWDFIGDSIAATYMVSHGCCDNPWAADSSRNNPTFSNTDGSHCSSLGKYRIGARGGSQWGIGVKYVLHGLEPTNSNAQRRQIVLHSWDMVSDTAVFPTGTPEGWGCPAVSNAAMKEIDADIRKETDPVLLWIFTGG